MLFEHLLNKFVYGTAEKEIDLRKTYQLNLTNYASSGWPNGPFLLPWKPRKTLGKSLFLNFSVLFEEWFIPSLFLAFVPAQLIEKFYWLSHCPCWFQQVQVNEIFSSFLSIIWDRFSFIFLLVTLKIEELYCKSSLSNSRKRHRFL